jgi:hypothetical protein
VAAVTLMRVLYLVDTLEVGGTERSLLDLLPRLDSVRPLLCSLYSGDRLLPAFRAAGVEVDALGLTGKYSLLTAARGVREVARGFCPDLIHSSLYRSDLVGRIVGRSLGTPVINSIVSERHGPLRGGAPGRPGTVKRAAVHLVDRATAGLVARFIANSHAA